MNMTPGTEHIVFGGGCFWCLDASYKLLKGVTSVEQVYAGGTLAHPTYAQVCSGMTGHAEVVRVTFNPTVIALSVLLDIFWTIHDPTTLNRQGYDVGTAYRSIILYSDEAQRIAAENSKQAAQASWSNPIVTKIVPLKTFYLAEDYQNNYETDRPDYCQIIINPKLNKLRQKFSEFLK
jgi:peptide-methionine (S)-S-oxide reductase